MQLMMEQYFRTFEKIKDWSIEDGYLFYYFGWYFLLSNWIN